MASTQANGITIEYEEAGKAGDPVLLLIMGLGAQLIAWDDEFVDALVGQGLRVVRYDNRDVGLSTWFDDAGVPDIAAALAGQAKAPYLLEDMADDAAALLSALGVDSAHVVGASMGGMIAQSLVIHHPGKVRTLTSIMSTTGDRSVGVPHPEAMQALMAPPPTGREEAIESGVRAQKVIGSPGYPMDEDTIRAKGARAYDRAFHPAGTARQLVAVLSSPDRTPGLAGVTCPTLVVHGEADPLVDPSGGRATAAAIPGAELWMLPGVGHDLPRDLHQEVADRIGSLCRRT